MTEEQLKKIKISMGTVFVAAMLLLSRQTAEYVTTGSGDVIIHRDMTGLSEGEKDVSGERSGSLVVVIDAGHGSGNLRKVTKGK